VTVNDERAQRLDCPRTIAAPALTSATKRKSLVFYLEVFAMIIPRAVILTVLVALASPLSAALAARAFSAAGTVTAQLEPKDFSTRRPTICTEQYAPVCGRINGVLKTYSNQCHARADGADVIAQGSCTDSVVPPGPR